jgi:hypothetical protein
VDDANVRSSRAYFTLAARLSHNHPKSQQMKIFSLLFPLTIGLGLGLDVAARSQHIPVRSLAKKPIVPDRVYADVRGSKVSLIKPQGFTTADTFPGFQQDSTQASIVVTELPASYQQAVAGFTAANLKTRGMTQIGREQITVDGNPGLLLQLTQAANGTTYRKWIAIFGDANETVTIVATVPQTEKPSLFRSLRSSVTSAKWNKTKVVDPFADLKYAVTATPDLKFTKRIQNSLLYTKDGVVPAKDPNDPILVVSQAISTVVVIDPKDYSQKRLALTPQAKNIEIVSTDPVTVDGLQGYEIVANAIDASTNKPIVLYQVMLFEGQTYYIIQGLVDNNTRSKYLPEFKKIATSFRKK